LIAVITLALGIGLNTAIFSLINDRFLRGLPFKEPQRLVHMYSNARDRKLLELAISVPRFQPRGFCQLDNLTEDVASRSGPSPEALINIADVADSKFCLLSHFFVGLSARNGVAALRSRLGE
jgi:hypothetical protein